MSGTITQTLRCEVVKPLDGDWDSLGRTMRTLSIPLHRVMNAIVTELELDQRRRAKGGKPGAWTSADATTKRSQLDRKTKKRVEGEVKITPRSCAYRYANTFWEREREAAQLRVKNGKPYQGDESIAEIDAGSNVVLGVAGAAFARWSKWRKESWKGTMTLPTFKGGSPIYVSAAGVELNARDGSYILGVRLTAGRGQYREIIVKPYGPSGYAAISRIATGEAKLGDLRLAQERHDGKRKWQAFLSYTMDARPPATGRTMALHRGVTTFLTAAIAREGNAEAYTTVLETGGDILHHKAMYAARRRSLGQQKRQLGTGAKGHGVARREEHMTRLQDAEARWVENKCREVAAHAMRLAEKKGVGRILIEDWTNPAKDGAPDLGEHVEFLVRSFPLAQLCTALKWAAKKHGFVVEIVETDCNSKDCPLCAHRHEQAQSGTFRCEKCELERNADVVFAWNMLLRDGKPSPIEDANKAEKRDAARLRKEAPSNAY